MDSAPNRYIENVSTNQMRTFDDYCVILVQKRSSPKDNPAWAAACEAHKVLPVFVLEPELIAVLRP